MDFNELKKSALERHIPIIMDDTLSVIKEILINNNVKNLLEIGSAIGYSAICFSKYVKKIDTIELDIERYNEAKDNIKSFNLQDKINIINGDALEILPTLNDKYDVIFIDASKSKYPRFLDYSLELLNKNGIIIADNVLYKGYVLGDYNKHKQRTAVRNLREFIKKCEDNEHLQTEILEVGDGLAVIKRANKWSNYN